jgi:hypothetical protein
LNFNEEGARTREAEGEKEECTLIGFIDSYTPDNFDLLDL